MNKTNEKILIRSAIIIPVLAIASFFIVTDLSFASQARELDRSTSGYTKSQDVLVQKYQDDAKWMQINDRVVLQPWDTSEVTDISFLDKIPFPGNVLPGYLSLKEAANRVVEADQRQNSERSLGRTKARMQAKSFCKMAESTTPEQLPTSKVELMLSDETLPNLPLYSEYCGVDALAYKDAVAEKWAAQKVDKEKMLVQLKELENTDRIEGNTGG